MLTQIAGRVSVLPPPAGGRAGRCSRPRRTSSRSRPP